MSNSVWTHRWQPTRFPRPWDSPGKNTGVGCYFLLQCMKVKVKVTPLSPVWLLATPWTAAHQAPPSMGFSRQEYNYNLCMHAKSLQLCLTLCDLMGFTSPGSSSMGFSRQEYWSGLSFPPPGDLPSLGIEPTSLMSSALAGRLFTTWEAPNQLYFNINKLLCCHPASHQKRISSIEIAYLKMNYH